MGESRRIVVINPNSTVAVTEGIDAAMAPFRAARLVADDTSAAPLAITCATLGEGPPGIETQEQVDLAVPSILTCIRREQDGAAAFVIACFSDPGLHAAREISTVPVLGIAESALHTACTLGDRFGVLSIKATSIPRHMRMVRAIGLADRCAGDRAIELSVVELADEARTYARMAEVGARLRDEDGAQVVIMGCAGMARYRARLTHDLGVPVVEPTQAAVAQALGLVALGWTPTARNATPAGVR